MDDALQSGTFECVSYLADDADGRFRIESAIPGDQFLETHSVDEFHRDVVKLTLLAQFKRLDDVGVIELHRGTSLSMKPRHAFGVPSRLVRKQLQCHRTCRLGVLRTQHKPHAALAQRIQDLVLAQEKPHRPPGQQVLDLVGGQVLALDQPGPKVQGGPRKTRRLLPQHRHLLRRQQLADRNLLQEVRH